MKAHTKETQATMTPEKSLQYLKEGNQRFQDNLKANRNLLEQVNDTSDGQFPFATILNFVNQDILGSMEFACKLAGTELIVVLGHTSCGAVKGACDHAEMGNLTKLVQKITPAVNAVTEPKDESLRTSKNLDFVDEVSHRNVELMIDRIHAESPILTEMEKAGEIKIIGAMYDVNTGAVTFYE